MVGSIQGERLANRYRVLRLLAEGSAGAVYLAEDVSSGQRVAVKVLIPELSFEARTLPHLRARLQRGLRLPRRRVRAIDHVVDLVDLGVLTNDDLYVVMPYLEGDHLRALVSRRGALSWAQARVPLIQLGRLIADYQREMITLGLGPVLGSLQASNCYCLRGQAREDSIRIIQSGVDDLILRKLWREPGDHVRSLARYGAPEIGTGDKLDVRADVYSLGVIAFELLTGHLPFDDPNAARLAAMHMMSPPPRPSAVASEQTIPDEVEAMILRALAKDPGDRFESMDMFVEAMTSLPGRLVQATRIARATLPGVEDGEPTAAESGRARIGGVEAAADGPVSSTRNPEGRAGERADASDPASGAAASEARVSLPSAAAEAASVAAAGEVAAPAERGAGATSGDVGPPVAAAIVASTAAPPSAAGPAPSSMPAVTTAAPVSSTSTAPAGSAPAIAATASPATASPATASATSVPPTTTATATTTTTATTATMTTATTTTPTPTPPSPVAISTTTRPIAGARSDFSGVGIWIALALALAAVLAVASLVGVDRLRELVGGEANGVVAVPAGAEAREARELLHQARLAEQRGDAITAYRLASGSYEQTQTIEALEVMGRSACLVGDLDSARWIFRHLPPTSQPAIRSVCEGAGIRLDP